jgi:hypothetical protein
LVARERTEGRRVIEKYRDIPQITNCRVILDRMRVVEMETVVKMIRIGRDEGKNQERVADCSWALVTQRSEHQSILPGNTR